MADDLVTWLRAQLDDDEKTAQAGTLTPPVPSWRASENGVYDAGVADDSSALVVAQTEWDEVAEHIARHDPARVLVEVAAKRRILDRCEHYIRYEDYGGPLAEEVLALLALPYADRPGYREDWRP